MTSLALNDNRDNDTMTIGAFFMSYKFRAALITILIHAAILLFFWFYYIYTPIPPFPVPVNTPELELDLVSGGGGSSNAGNAASSTNTVTPVVKTTASNTPTINNDIEPSTPIPSNKSKVVPKKIDTVPKPQQPSIALANAEDKFKHAKASSSGNGSPGGQGNGGGGSGTGIGPGTGSGTGIGPGGSGKGFGYDLSGRQLEVRPNLVTNNPEQGQIVVGITVDADGNVTEATPGMVGTTITDASLYVLVKNAAMKIKFNKSHDDSPEQQGTVTFSFTIH